MTTHLEDRDKIAQTITRALDVAPREFVPYPLVYDNSTRALKLSDVYDSSYVNNKCLPGTAYNSYFAGALRFRLGQVRTSGHTLSRNDVKFYRAYVKHSQHDLSHIPLVLWMTPNAKSIVQMWQAEKVVPRAVPTVYATYHIMRRVDACEYIAFLQDLQWNPVDKLSDIDTILSLYKWGHGTFTALHNAKVYTVNNTDNLLSLILLQSQHQHQQDADGMFLFVGFDMHNQSMYKPWQTWRQLCQSLLDKLGFDTKLGSEYDMDFKVLFDSTQPKPLPTSTFGSGVGSRRFGASVESLPTSSSSSSFLLPSGRLTFGSAAKMNQKIDVLDPDLVDDLAFLHYQSKQNDDDDDDDYNEREMEVLVRPITQDTQDTRDTQPVFETSQVPARPMWKERQKALLQWIFTLPQDLQISALAAQMSDVYTTYIVTNDMLRPVTHSLPQSSLAYARATVDVLKSETLDVWLGIVQASTVPSESVPICCICGRLISYADTDNPVCRADACRRTYMETYDIRDMMNEFANDARRPIVEFAALVASARVLDVQDIVGTDVFAFLPPQLRLANKPANYNHPLLKAIAQRILPIDFWCYTTGECQPPVELPNLRMLLGNNVNTISYLFVWVVYRLMCMDHTFRYAPEDREMHDAVCVFNVGPSVFEQDATIDGNTELEMLAHNAPMAAWFSIITNGLQVNPRSEAAVLWFYKLRDPRERYAKCRITGVFLGDINASNAIMYNDATVYKDQGALSLTRLLLAKSSMYC